MNADPHACPFGGTWGKEASIHATKQQEENFPPMYSDGSNDDFDKAADAKMAASDLKSQGLYKESLEKFTEAVLAAEPSALLMANRAHVLFKLKKYAAAIRDCDYALEKNPDSAKALRIRGECNLKVEKYHAALKDLSAAQTIDFDEEAAIMLKEATEKCRELDAVEVKKKVEEEEKLKKRAAEVRAQLVCAVV
jgi:suppressor of tumorigenicity protein 13